VASSRWPRWSLLPLGLGSWAPIYAGVRARVRSWIGLGVACSAVTLAGWVVAVASNGGPAGGLLILAGWVAAVATSYVIRTQYEERIRSPLTLAEDQASLRMLDRRRALELARTNPALAAEIGVGRPDRDDAVDAGLVDLNNASVSALLKLPGIDDRLATKIVEARAEVNGFSSLEDCGAALDLPGDAVERLRGRVVFLPRQ
jgi:DNA uptake protein ComE-like DNA-binding protein